MTSLTFQLPPLFDYFATFLWALSGAIVGMHKRYDMAGVCVIALLAATGGSTLRDGLFLNQLPPVLTDVWYLPLILFAALVVRFFRQRIADMKLIDALGVPAFAVVGMQMSLAAGLPAPGLPGGKGWVSADFVLATHAENVPVIASPPVPTPRPPTPTPVPTARPTAAPPPPATPSPDISFWADRTNINQGECATLNWSVNNVQAVWVYPLGEHYSRFPRTGQGNERVCPSSTRTWEMRVLMRDGSTNFRQVTINVAAPAPPPPPPPAAPLAGTRWNVVNYNNGNAIVTLLPDSSVSMEFGADGQVTGSAGCNNYFASFQASGNNITIGHPGATSRFCAEPPGVMEQETRFLAALQSAATYRLNGNSLEIKNAGGQIAIVANRAP